ncbi:MAG: methyltransferase [Rhodothermales bacterium]
METVRIRYQTIEFGDIDVHVRSLRDNQQFSDPLGEAEALGISSAQWSLFGVVWKAGEVLAHEMAQFNIEGKRILEVGCGMALASLLLKCRGADITATDYHPEAGAFLTENVRLNRVDDIPFLQTSWENEQDGLGQFDVVIGADILYEAQHIELLSEFIDRHAKPVCEVVIVDPSRGLHAQFSKKMIALGYEHTQYKPEPAEGEDTPFKGQVLRYERG